MTPTGIEGEFFERFELQNFPFDAQDLSVTISFNCATEGPVPVEVVCPPSAHLGVDTSIFAFADVWILAPTLTGESTTVGATAQRRFPALHVRASVSRRANFVLWNVAMPMSFISLLPSAIFVVEHELTAIKLDLSVTILLTAVAFKFVTAAYLPQISYMTLIDKYLLGCTVIIYTATFFVAILGALHNWAQMREEVLVTLNKIAFGITLSCWVVVHIRFLAAGRRAGRQGTERGITRASHQEGHSEGSSDHRASEEASTTRTGSFMFRSPRMLRASRSQEEEDASSSEPSLPTRSARAGSFRPPALKGDRVLAVGPKRIEPYP